VTNSFTLENSFYGYEHGDKIKLFTSENYKSIGYKFA